MLSVTLQTAWIFEIIVNFLYFFGKSSSESLHLCHSFLSAIGDAQIQMLQSWEYCRVIVESGHRLVQHQISMICYFKIQINDKIEVACHTEEFCWTNWLLKGILDYF